MNGFSLYETLRLVIPGALAAALVSLVSRLVADSPDTLTSTGGGIVTGSFSGVEFSAVSLVLGFLLYVVDLPTKTRVFQEGDPKDGRMRPSDTLRTIIDQTHGPDSAFLKSRNLSLYFLLMDAHLPAELHRKVYFFGGMYRIYSDARILSMAALCFGPPLGFMLLQSRVALSVDTKLWAPGVVAISYPLWANAVAGVGHAVNSRAKHRELSFKPYRSRLREGVKEVGIVSAIIFALVTSSWLLCSRGLLAANLAGSAAAIAAFALWFFVEVGPVPDGERATTPRVWTLRLLGCRPSPDAQFMPAQRAFVDLALITGAIGAAATLVGVQGRSPWDLLWWAVLAAVGTVISTTRKHEQRLISSYTDQSTWLELNSHRIKRMVRDRADQSTWVDP